MKLNVLKWIYHLGYSRAQDRLYFGLKQEIIRYQKNNDMYHLNVKGDSDYDKGQREQIERNKAELELFIMIVDSVFKPEQQVEIRVEDKFRV